jgi:hypothetical protein
MRRTGRAALVAAAGVLLSPVAGGQESPHTTVTVVDHLSTGQQEETIAVYFAGVLAGTLHVDASKPDDQFVAMVPARDHIGYTLCGKLLRREADGSLSTHPIDNGGVLAGYAGHTLAATTLHDVLFSLEDLQGDAGSTVRPGPSCTAAVS